MSEVNQTVQDKSQKTPISLERLRAEMFRRGLTRKELAALAGLSTGTLSSVFTTGKATTKTKLAISVVLYGREVVADPDLLEKSA